MSENLKHSDVEIISGDFVIRTRKDSTFYSLKLNNKRCSLTFDHAYTIDCGSNSKSIRDCTYRVNGRTFISDI